MNPSCSTNQPYAARWNSKNTNGPAANNRYGLSGSGPVMGSPGHPAPNGPVFSHSHGPPYGPGPYGLSNGPGQYQQQPMGSQSPRMHSPYHNHQSPAVGYQPQYTAIRIPPGASSTPPMMVRSDSSGNEDSYQGRFDSGVQIAPDAGYSASFEALPGGSGMPSNATAAGGFPANAGASAVTPAQSIRTSGVQDQRGVIQLPKSYKTYYSLSVPPPIAHKPAFPLLVPPPRPSNLLGPAG